MVSQRAAEWMYPIVACGGMGLVLLFALALISLEVR